jgi:hypothetical protein
MTTKLRNKRRKADVYEKYRRILKMPGLTDKKIDEMRKHLSLLTRTICEHVWRKKFY